MKLFIYTLSLVVSAVIAQGIIAVFIVILYLPSVSNAPQVVSAMVLITGISMAILLGVLSFKKLLRYLKREFKYKESSSK
jgi:Kef-type K+ transport system membrane component KefB